MRLNKKTTLQEQQDTNDTQVQIQRTNPRAPLTPLPRQDHAGLIEPSRRATGNKHPWSRTAAPHADTKESQGEEGGRGGTRKHLGFTGLCLEWSHCVRSEVTGQPAPCEYNSIKSKV